MAITDVTICNSALVKVGAQRIGALSDNTDRARLCNEQYDKNRLELLYSHPWNFAIERVELSADATDPTFEWSSRFQLPNDCLRVWGTDQGSDAWHVEGRYLVANVETIKIVYIKDVTNESQFTPGFAEVLALKIAADIAYALTQSSGLADMLMKQYEKRLAFVRSYDAQESVGDRVYADTWLNSRF